MNRDKLRNIAIIAHVYHGKTTMVDKILQQSGTKDRKNMTTDITFDDQTSSKYRGHLTSVHEDLCHKEVS